MYVVIEVFPSFSRAAYNAATREFKVKRILSYDSLDGIMGFDVEDGVEKCLETAKPVSLKFPATAVGVLYGLEPPRYAGVFENGKEISV